MVSHVAATSHSFSANPKINRGICDELLGIAFELSTGKFTERKMLALELLGRLAPYFEVGYFCAKNIFDSDEGFPLEHHNSDLGFLF